MILPDCTDPQGHGGPGTIYVPCGCGMKHPRCGRCGIRLTPCNPQQIPDGPLPTIARVVPSVRKKRWWRR